MTLQQGSLSFAGSATIEGEGGERGNERYFVSGSGGGCAGGTSEWSWRRRSFGEEKRGQTRDAKAPYDCFWRCHLREEKLVRKAHAARWSVYAVCRSPGSGGYGGGGTSADEAFGRTVAYLLSRPYGEPGSSKMERLFAQRNRCVCTDTNKIVRM